MKLGTEVQGRSGGRFGSLPVEIKTAGMSKLVGEAKELKVITVSEITSEEKARFTSGLWELHGKGSGTNYAVIDSKGLPVVILSKTMLVYFVLTLGSRIKAESLANVVSLVRSFPDGSLGEKGETARAQVMAKYGKTAPKQAGK